MTLVVPHKHCSGHIKPRQQSLILFIDGSNLIHDMIDTLIILVTVVVIILQLKQLKIQSSTYLFEALS